MTSTQKIAIAGALLGSLAVVILKKVLEGVISFEDGLPVLHPVRDAASHREEPLSSSL